MNDTYKPIPNEAPQKDAEKVQKEAPKKTTKKVVLKMDASVPYDDKIHKKVMEALSVGVSGFESIKVDKKNKVITIRGDVKATELGKKLKKACDRHIEIDTVEDVKETEVQNPSVVGVVMKVLAAMFS